MTKSEKKLEKLRNDGLHAVNRKLFGTKDGFDTVIETAGNEDDSDSWFVYDYTIWLEGQVLKLRKKLDID